MLDRHGQAFDTLTAVPTCKSDVRRGIRQAGVALVVMGERELALRIGEFATEVLQAAAVLRRRRVP